MTDDREHRIRERAHRIWESEGNPEGRHEDHWDRASREVDDESSAAAGSEVGSGDAGTAGGDTSAGQAADASGEPVKAGARGRGNAVAGEIPTSGAATSKAADRAAPKRRTAKPKS